MKLKIMLALTVAQFSLSAFAAETLIPESNIETVSFDQLKEKCRKYTENPQTNPFTTNITCKRSAKFWVKKGQETFTLENDMQIIAKAHVKGDAFQTSDWKKITATKDDQGFCNVYEQYRADSAFEGLNVTCAELQNYESEKDFCTEKMESTWNECAADMTKVANSGTLKKTSQACAIRPVIGRDGKAITKGCNGTPVTAVADTTSSSVSTSEELAPEVVAQINSDIKELDFIKLEQVEVDRGSFLHHKFKLVRIVDAPQGGLLARYGLQTGDMVREINGHNVGTVKEFKKHMTKLINTPGKFEIIYGIYNKGDNKVLDYPAVTVTNFQKD